KISPQSKYCKLIFADDWIFPECIERMVSVAESAPAVGIVGAYVLQGKSVKCVGLPYRNTVFDGREICRRHFLNGLYVFESANAVLYRSDLVREKPTFYNERNIHADTEACFALLRDSDFGFVHQILTYTRVRPESLSSVSSDLQTYLAGMLRVLLVYGPEYLSEKELDSLIRRHAADYYRFLGKCLLLGRRQIVKYHNEKLTEAGLRFEWPRVVAGMLSTVWKLALHPFSTGEKVLRTRKLLPSSHKSST